MGYKPDRMVLRTVYLPPDIDAQLRAKAFEFGMTKNDLIREAVMKSLTSITAKVEKPSTVSAKALEAKKPSTTSAAARKKKTVTASPKVKTLAKAAV